MATTHTSSSSAAAAAAAAATAAPAATIARTRPHAAPTARYSAHHKPRPAKQGLASSTSPDLISNLLASLPSGVRANEETEVSHLTGLPIPTPRSSSRTSRRSLTSQNRPSIDSRRRDPSADFEEIVSHPQDTQQLAADDAAESPAIRTARPPSGRTRYSVLPTQARQAGPAASANPPAPLPRPASQTSTSRGADTNNESPGGLNVGKVYRAPASGTGSGTASRKDSLQSLRKEAARAKDNQGGQATPRVMSAFGRYDDIPASSPRSSSRASNASAQARIQNPGPSRLGQRTLDASDADDDDNNNYNNNNNKLDDPESLAERNPIDKPVSGRSSPLTTRLTSSRTGHYQPEQGGIKEQDEDPLTDDPEQNTETLRRIRELKAAKMERMRISGDYGRDSPTPIEVTPATPPPLKNGLILFPSQSPRDLAAQKIARNQEVESPLPAAAASPPVVNFSRGQVSPSANKTSFHSPSASFNLNEANRAMSPPTVQSGRWSQQDLRPSSASPSKDRIDDSASLRGRPSFAGGESQRSQVDPVGQDVEDFLHAPRLSQKITIPEEQRVVSFSEVGDPDGHPVFCCVGMGMTRFVMTFYDDLAVSLKLRLITPDRPGIGDSTPCRNGSGTPLRWPDDVSAICAKLDIEEFSLIAHSAGAVYALATALRLPHQVRGKIHLLAPWIPPSQMSAIGLSKSQPRPTGSLPRSQRILRILPTSFLKAANSSWMGTTSSSLFGSPKPAPYTGIPGLNSGQQQQQQQQQQPSRPGTSLGLDRGFSLDGSRPPQPGSPVPPDGRFTFPRAADRLRSAATSPTPTMTMSAADRQKQYDQRLTPIIWDLSTRRGNPAVDLLVCLERSRPIGFRYMDINRAVVIHHGNKDTRVPIDNVKWLGKTMRRTEVRVLNGEGHGLMASAGVMGSVLTELSKELDT